MKNKTIIQSLRAFRQVVLLVQYFAIFSAAKVCSNGSVLGSLLPRLIHTWTKILEDVMQSPYVLDLKRKLVQELFTHKEFTSLSIDATIRLMRRVKGQEDYRAPAEVRNDAPIPDTEAKRRILSIVGRTGTTIGLSLVPAESNIEIARVLME